jgi:hypothetical protein
VRPEKAPDIPWPFVATHSHRAWYLECQALPQTCGNPNTPAIAA